MREQHGVTLIELIIVLVIGAILVGLAVPSFREIGVSNRMATQTNELVGHLQLARSEAAKRNRRVFVRAPGGWTAGWQVVEDTDNSGAFSVGDTTLRQAGAIGGGMAITATGGATALTYLRTGAMEAANPLTFTVCIPGNPGNYGRQVVVSLTGRPNLVTGVACP